MRHDAPRDDLAIPFSNRPFERLGSAITVGKSTLIVELSNLTGTADKTVVADAVYLVRKAPMRQSVYSSQGLLTATNDALGKQTTYAYDARGRMVRVTQPDPDGAGSLAAPISSSHYNGAGQLTAAIGPDLSVSTFQYDTLGRQTAAYRGGLVHNRARAYAKTGPWSDGSNQGLFDAERVATTVTGSATAAATWTFGGLTVGDDYGVFLTWTADQDNATDASIKIYAESTGTTAIWSETIDMTEAPGAARNSVLQPIDFAAKDFQRLDGVFTATAGTIIVELSNLSATAGRMVVADTVYVVREDAIGRTVYDHAGRVWKTLDPEGFATTRTYDNLGRLVKLSQPDPDNGGNNPALVVDYAYDATGQTTHVTQTNAASSFARVTKTDYDAHGRASRSVRIIGQDDDFSAETDDIVTGYAYDALGRMTSQTDPLNHATSYTFDNLGRKTRETNALSGQTDYAYDIAGRMTSLTDPEENTTRWAFGIAGSVFTESINVNSVNLVRTFEYNAAGNLVRKIDRNGRVIAYGYDALSRQTAETWYDNVTDANAQKNARKTSTTAYNDLGQVASIGDGATEYEYTYGLFGKGCAYFAFCDVTTRFVVIAVIQHFVRGNEECTVACKARKWIDSHDLAGACDVSLLCVRCS